MNTTKNPKTNSKEVKAKIQEYIISCIDTSEDPEHDGTLWKSMFIICNDAQNIAFTKYEIHQNKTYQDAFIYWLQGLPSNFNVEMYHKEILELMASFGLPLPPNKTESEGIELFYRLIYREFCVLAKNNGLVFPIYNI